jgi:outer membrane beta-barrel protein
LIFIRIALIFFTCNLYAGIKNVYKYKWLDPKKKVYVLQNKIHPNKNAWNFTLGWGNSQLSDFQDSTGIHVTASYHFLEEWGVELFYTAYANSNNSSYEAIQSQTGQVIPHIITFDNVVGANLIFSPFYGKLNTFNKIFYIDWSFGAGLGMASSQDNTQDFISPGGATSQLNRFTRENRMTLSLKTQVKWHVTDRFKVLLDFNNYFTNLPEPEFGMPEAMRRSFDLIFSVGMKF